MKQSKACLTVMVMVEAYEARCLTVRFRVEVRVRIRVRVCVRVRVTIRSKACLTARVRAK